MAGHLNEKCAVFGVVGKNLQVARLTYAGLYSLQHRGQESSGISVSNGKKITTHKAMGLVHEVYKEAELHKLKGSIAIGHNRYSTSKASLIEHSQPFTGEENIVALAHNGNLPKVKALETFLNGHKIKTDGLSDSRLMHLAITVFMKKGLPVEKAVKEAFPLFTGAFCILIMTKNKIVALRDSFGIRPLSIGKLKNGYVFASETCALDTVGATHIRDVLPGEMVVETKNNLKSYKLAKANQQLDIFEFVYFSRHDSILLGKRVYDVRKNLGKKLAEETSIKADVVVPVPDSSVPAALGYSAATGIPLEFGLMKNRYIGRTFIMPTQKLRNDGVHIKLNPIKEILKGKRVVIIDDSIVRGTTIKKIIKLVKSMGAKKIHILITCPPVKYPDFYGIDTPMQDKLIASRKTVSQIRKFIGADSLYYLSYEGLLKATGLNENLFCTSCFTGKYPIDIGEHAKQILTEGNHKNNIKRIAVCISNTGTGTNLQAIIDGVEQKKINAKIVSVISDTIKAKGLKRARKHKLPIKICSRKEKLLPLLRKLSVDYICLAGWKQIIPDETINAFPNRILNTHPGLIPNNINGIVKNPDDTKAIWNRGKMTNKAIQSFLDNRSTYAGCSNHFLSNNFDHGKVLGRCYEKIEKRDTVEALYKRLKLKENQLYVRVLSKLCE